MRIKKRPDYAAIAEFCNERNCTYADFQKMESLGYVAVCRITPRKYFVSMVMPRAVAWYLKECKAC